MGYAIRDKRYRYVEWVENGPHVSDSTNYNDVADKQLFDYLVDPMETKNLAGHPEYFEVQNELDSKLDEYYQRVLEGKRRIGE